MIAPELHEPGDPHDLERIAFEVDYYYDMKSAEANIKHGIRWHQAYGHNWSKKEIRSMKKLGKSFRSKWKKSRPNKVMRSLVLECMALPSGGIQGEEGDVFNLGDIFDFYDSLPEGPQDN